MGLELHGLDLLAGASDELLVPLLECWLAAAADCCAGAPWTSVEFPGVGWFVAMQRVGAEALLLHRIAGRWGEQSPRPVRVPLGEVRGALAEGAAGLLREVQGGPGGAAQCAGLERALIRLRGARIQPPRTAQEVTWPRAVTADGPLTLRWTGEPDRGAVRSGDPAALEWIPGRLELVGPGLEVTVPGARLLPLAHALADAAEELAAPGDGPVELLHPPGLRFERGRLSGQDVGVEISPGALARVLNRFGQAAAALLIELHPPCARVPSVEGLLARTTEALATVRSPRALPGGGGPFPREARAPRAGPRLSGPGAVLKRLSFEQRWHAAVPGAENLSLGRASEVVAWGRTSLASFTPAGALRARLTGADGISVSPAGDKVVASVGGALVGLALDGRVPLWTTWRRLPSDAVPRGSLLVAGECCCVLALGRGPCGLSTWTGRELWRIASRGSAWFAGTQGRCWISTESGSLLQVHSSSGAVAAAVHGPLPHVCAPSVHGRRVSAVATSDARAELTVVDARSGEVLLRRPVSLGRAGPAVPCDRRWYLPGERGGEARLLALTATGKSAWERPLPGPGPWRLSSCAGGLLATNRAGAAICVETTGRVRWTAGSPAPDESPGPIPPAVRRGVAFAFGPQVRALDGRSGELLAELPLAAPARTAVVDPSLSLWVLDEAGNVTSWRLGTHLAAVSPSRRG